MSRIFSCSRIITIMMLITVWVFSVNLSSAQADWRKDIGVFRIGIITSERSVEALDRLEPFKLAISEALNMDVEFFRAQTATALMDAIRNERIEYAIFSASGYALAWAACECIEPLVVPRSKDSTDGYHTILVSRPDGPQTLETLNGNKIGILSENSIVGAPYAKHILAEANIIIGDEKTPFISNQATHKTFEMFANGEIETLLGWSSMTGDPSSGYSRGTLKQLSELYDANVRNYKILWKSDQIPHRPHVVRKKIHGDAKKILRSTLLSMNDKDPVAYDAIEPVYGGGFVTSRHERFEQLISFMKAQGAQTKTAEETLPLQ